MPQAAAFSGTVMMYGKPIFVDTSDGTGFVEILDSMKPFLDSFSRWGGRDPSQDECDMRQDARLAAIEGVMSYRKETGTQLSTFLHTHVRNRMVDASRKRRLSQIPLDDASPDAMISRTLSPEDRVLLMRVLESWDARWRKVMFRAFVLQDKIKDIARDERMSPWSLTRAIRRKIRAIQAQ